MAVDEWLLSTAHLRPPVLRLYGWVRPTVSLGRHEPWRDVVDLRKLELSGVDLVRRPTGGRAVLHDREITYSVTAPTGDGATWSARLDTALSSISKALVRGLQGVGVPAEFAPVAKHSVPRASGRLCFESTTRYELRSGGVKAVGSAQYRTETGFLQHGSIPSRATLAALWRLGPGTSPCPVDPELPREVAGLADRPAEEVAAALARGFEEEFGMCGVWRGLEVVDRPAAEQLVTAKYASAEWTLRR